MHWLEVLNWLTVAVAVLAVFGALAVLVDDDDDRPVALWRWTRTLPTL